MTPSMLECVTVTQSLDNTFPHHTHVMIHCQELPFVKNQML